MTMRVIYKQAYEGRRVGKEEFIERTLGRRLYEKGIVIPYKQHLDEVYEAEQAKIAEKEKIEAEAKAVEEAKAAEAKAAKEAEEAKKPEEVVKVEADITPPKTVVKKPYGRKKKHK